MPASAAVDRRSVLALAVEWAVVAAAIAVALELDAWWAYALAFVVVATRQHALLILYHDAVHGHFARKPRLNDAIVNLAVGVPALLPVEIYRPLHLEHHRALGTETDPERQLLFANQPWRYRPLPLAVLARQILGDLFVVNGVRAIVAWRKTRPMPPLRPQTFAIAAVWLAALGGWLVVAPGQALSVLALWFLPLLTLTQLLQKVRSFAEHSGGPGVTPGWEDWSYSWRPGVLGRLTIWPYNISYHREHHARPALHWHALPYAAATAGAGSALSTRSLWRLLCAPSAGAAEGPRMRA